jgi:membrane-bound metal-dependent hydrolase YbcI (DUF457 family)
MMAFGHAASGWCTALMIINWLALFQYAVAPSVIILSVLSAALVLSVLSALAMAGSAILLDWDHQSSTITTAFGHPGFWIHYLVVELHYTVCDITKTGGDRKPPGPHRGVTHWWPFPLTVGTLVAFGSWLSHWVVFGVLVILFTGAIRALTIPDRQSDPDDTVRHRWSMQMAHGILDASYASLACLAILGVLGAIFLSKWVLFGCCILMLVSALTSALKHARRYTNRTRRILWVSIPVGKIGTIVAAVGLAFIAIRYPIVAEHGEWLGALMMIGMYAHILGDAPTHMGVPGPKLTQVWRLPKWLAFKAGGPFELGLCWLPMAALGVYLIPGFQPREEVLQIQEYIVWGLGVMIVGAAIIEYGSRYMKRKAWIVS